MKKILSICLSACLIILSALTLTASAADTNEFAGDHYIYFTRGDYGRIIKFTVDSTEKTVTLNCIAGSEDYSNGKLFNPNDPVTVSWKVDGSKMDVTVSNFNNENSTYLGETAKVRMDGTEISFTKTDTTFSFTTEQTGSAHIIYFTNTAYGRAYVFNINGTSGRVNDVAPLIWEDATSGTAVDFISTVSDERVNIEYTVDTEVDPENGADVTVKLSGWSYPSQCTGYVALDQFPNGNLNDNKKSANGDNEVLTASFGGILLPNLLSAEEQPSVQTSDGIVISLIALVSAASAAAVVFSKKRS
ncbi:MAG: hypothetical protein J5563_06435 [Clostridia bacterium]|nr:hypothetical protein [Clostridia bacterium]